MACLYLMIYGQYSHRLAARNFAPENANVATGKAGNSNLRRRGTMSLQSANEYISATKSSPELMAKIAEAITGKSPTDAAQAVSDLGRLNGFEFTAEDAMQARQAVLQAQKLSEDDLDGVAGGAGVQPVGGGFVSSGIVGTFPPNQTLPAPSFPGGTGTITDIAAGW